MSGPRIAARVRTPRTRLLGPIAVGVGGAGIVAGTGMHVLGHEGAGLGLLASLLTVTVGVGCLAAAVTPVRDHGREGTR